MVNESTMTLSFTLLKDTCSIYRLGKDAAIPGWIYGSEFYSVTRTRDELSVVCKHVENIPDNVIKSDKNWRVLKINGPLDLSMVGIIADLSCLLKECKISIFTISTFDTDYILVKDQYLNEALKVLKDNGHKIFQNHEL